MVTAIIFFVVLSVLILVHELGHFWVAKRAGVKVEEFGLGFPPRLFSIKKGETEYSFNLILFGGFVKIFGEDASEEQKPRSFGALPIGKRALILSAGVIMNFLLAVVLLALVSGIGRPAVIDESAPDTARDVSVRIVQVMSDSPAHNADLRQGDAVVAGVIDEVRLPMKDVETFQSFIEEHRGEEVTLVVERGSEEVLVTLVPRVEVPDDEGAIGVGIASVGIVQSPWWRAPWDGLVATVSLTATIVVVLGEVLWNLITGQPTGLELAGPLGIASLTGDAARLGIVYLLQFTAVLSINLAILNILPFPALDGGRLVFLAIEKVRGRAVDKGIEHAVNLVGFALLLLLMVWVTWQDIIRFF